MRPLALTIAMFMLSATTPPAAFAQPQPPATPPAAPSATPPASPSPADTPGPYVLVLHFLGDTLDDRAEASVRETLRESPGLAGVAHVFVTPRSQAGDSDRLKPLEASGARFLADPDARLQARFSASPAPTWTVLSPDRRELFRLAGAAPGEHPRFETLARRLADASRAANARDYNLPRPDAPAVEGFDVVSYFAGTPVKGDPAITSSYRGVQYRFASADNRARFALDPDRYTPAYGGWCASAMGDSGEKVGVSPTNFKIKDGRLFLFYKSAWADALKDWNKHERDWEPAADAHWQKLSGEPPRKPLANAPTPAK